MGFAKSRLDFFYANGSGSEFNGRVPNLIALEDIKADTPQGGVIFSKGTEFYLPIPLGVSKITAIGAEPIILGTNARVLTSAEVAAWKVKNALSAGTDVAQDVAKKALNEEGLVRKSNIAWWLLGGVVVYLVFFKK
jgi:hypothetical protein